MATGFWVVQGDKTTCGGSVLVGHPKEKKIGPNQNRQVTVGCQVSCGKHPGKYSVAGGYPGEYIHGQLTTGVVAGLTLLQTVYGDKYRLCTPSLAPEGKGCNALRTAGPAFPAFAPRWGLYRHNQLFSLIAFLPGISQRDSRICGQRKHYRLTVESVPKTPAFRTVRLNLQGQSIFI